MNYVSAATEWLQAFAVSSMVIGFLCILGGFLLYWLTDIVLALIARHA